MYLAILDVKPAENYNLILTFENGEKRIFDMKPYLETGIFRELKDPVLFNSVHLSFDTVEWSNQADFDPEVLFQDSIPIVNYTESS